MTHLIDKDALAAEINRLKDFYNRFDDNIKYVAKYNILVDILSFINTLKVIDPYEQCIQYPTVKDGIEAHAEVYSFNIESELFNQLTKEQQKLWRKEIEQACISGGNAGYLLARDPRYKENLEVKEVDLELIIGWFDHIAQIADDRMTLTGQRMTDAHALDEIKCLARNSSEFIKIHYKAHKCESSEQLLAEMRGEEPSIPDIVDEHFDEMLEEEPVSKVWHTTMEEPNGEDSIVIVYDNGCTVEPSFKEIKYYSEWGAIKQSYRVKLWAYLDVLLSLSTAERTGKNLKELKTMLDDSLSKETEDSWNEFLDKCKSEDLEEAAFDYAEACKYDGGEKLLCVEHFKAGANWQKEQDKQWLAEEHKHIFAKGRDSMKQRMMKNAITAECFGAQSGDALFSIRLPAKGYLVGSEIKVIIIKEE